MQSFFLKVVFFGVYSSTFGEIWAKILRTPNNLPAPTPKHHIIIQDGAEDRKRVRNSCLRRSDAPWKA